MSSPHSPQLTLDAPNDASRGRLRRSLMVDAAGGGFVLLAMALLTLSARFAGGEADGGRVLLLLLAVSYALARSIGRLGGWMVPLMVVLVAGGLVVLGVGKPYGHPLGGPFGYANAAGSFYMVAAAGAWMLVARGRWLVLKIAAAGAAVGFTVVIWRYGVVTAGVLACLLPVALLARRPAGVRKVVLVGGALVMAALGVTVLAGLVYEPTEEPGLVDGLVARAVSERRVVLWHDALNLLADHPLTGVGPGRFAVTSPTAMSDDDAAWAHNEFLELGAEAGGVGFLLGLALFGWGFVRLWYGAGDTGTAIAAAALAAVGVHACVDYILHFPAVGAAIVALVGAGSVKKVGAQR